MNYYKKINIYYKKMKIQIFIIFIFSFIIIDCVDSDFRVNYITPLEDNNFIKHASDVYVDVDISFGSNEDKFKSELDLMNYCTVVAGTDVEDNSIKKFDSSLSTTFVKKQEYGYIYSEKFYKAMLGEDTIKLGESKKIENMQFIVVHQFSNKINTGSYIGLGLDTIQSNFFGLNLLEQLKKKNIIDKQIWYLDFKDYNKGKFILGKYPHEINGKKYNKDDMYIIDILLSTVNNYAIGFEEVYYGKEKDYENRYIMEVHKTAKFSLNTRIITCTHEFGDYINKEFFTKKIDDKICFRDFINKKYNFYYCDKNKINLSEMQNLYFFSRNKNITFVLEPKDLFYEHNGYLYYLIIYKNYDYDDSDKETEWTFGLEFLKKYTLAFNRDDKVIYYYKTNENAKQDSKNQNDSGSFIYILIIIVLSIIFLICIAFLIYYIIKIKPRKTKANELDDDYDYQSKDNNIFDNSVNA